MALQLIYDRTQADVDRVRTLAAKGWLLMTPAERDLWMNGINGIIRGAYNIKDMNRVGDAIEFLRDILADAGYTVTVNPKTNWTRPDIPTPAQLDTYLSDVRTLRAVLPLSPDVPQVPDDMRFLTWSEANDIEKILVEIERVIISVRELWRLSGTFGSSDDVQSQKIRRAN